jgi:asparagine synthase (glutamine-hydrolysing)
MCGINGIFTYNSGTDYFQAITRMNDSIEHRGPDDKGILVQSHIALGHRRLTIDERLPKVHQPMSSDEGRYSIVFEGVIYNYKDIQEELSRPTAIGPGSIFKTNADTEVLLQAYIRYGKACLNRLNGIFSFAIWDEEKKELFVARDRMGNKPLYFHKNDEELVFSSELRSILKSGLVEKKISRKGLTDYLRYQTVHAPNTIVEGIKVLLPGHYLIINEEDFTIRKYWDVVEESQKEFIPTDYTILCEKLRSLVLNSVEMQMVDGVPLGAFSTGGIDSSVMIAAMSQLSSEQIKTYHVSFDAGNVTQSKLDRLVSEKFGTSHTEIKINTKDITSHLPEALRAMDHPGGEGLNAWFISRAAKDAGIAISFSSLGANELFAGYDIFKQMYQLREKRWLLSFPVFARRLAGRFLKALKPGFASEKSAEILTQDYFDLSYIYPFYRQVMLDNQVYKVLNKQLLDDNRPREIVQQSVEYGTPGFNLPYLSRISIAEMYTNLQNVLLRETGQMSIANGLEIRTPFLEQNLVRFVLAVEDKHKYPYSPKKLLVDAFKGLLTPEIIKQADNSLTFPWKQWMKNELKSFCEEKLNSLGNRDFINDKEIKKLWSDFLTDSPHASWTRVWHLVVLENWLDENQVV